MKILKLLLPALMVLGLSFSTAWAAGQLATQRGEAIFNDPDFAGISTSCSSCHHNGQGLKKVGEKTGFNILGETEASLEDAVNYCIAIFGNGQAIDVDSPKMKDLTAYIKTLR